MDVSENSGFYPQIIHFNRVFHYFDHPFWGSPIFGNTHITMRANYFLTGMILQAPTQKHTSLSSVQKKILKDAMVFMLTLSNRIDPMGEFLVYYPIPSIMYGIFPYIWLMFIW